MASWPTNARGIFGLSSERRSCHNNTLNLPAQKIHPIETFMKTLPLNLNRGATDDGEVRATREDRIVMSDSGIVGVVGQTADPEEPQQVVATVTFPTAKVPNVYAKTPGNVEIGFEERLFKKARPMAFTGEDLGKFGQVVSALCGWKNGTEARAPYWV